MRMGYWATTGLACFIALIAKDLAMPLVGIALFGLVDRLLANTPFAGMKTTTTDLARP